MVMSWIAFSTQVKMPDTEFTVQTDKSHVEKGNENEGRAQIHVPAHNDFIKVKTGRQLHLRSALSVSYVRRF